MRDRVGELDSILAQALVLTSDEERLAFLKQASGEDAEKLEQLLRRMDTLCSTSGSDEPDQARNKDETLALGSTATTFECLGMMIGNYRLLRRLGEGGFGVVYLAEQLQPVRRQVALKIIKVGMDTRHVIARFKAESQALAMMEHPGIAKVLDAGATDQGRPYFVMELVKGIPITSYCDQHRFGTRERLNLFVSVCRAIHHAHEKGIVHRDIKPSNVLVTTQDGVPAPRVIDFGIAKATAESAGDASLHTAANHLLGTPKYMSPEQAEGGGNVDARCDIYALGVLLCELLTGTTPFSTSREKSPARDELRRMILEEEPPRPSTMVSAMGPAGNSVAELRKTDLRALRGSLRGDLDWIILRCLEKQPQRRYDTAEQLADEVLRHLENRPVLAGPPSWSYRIRKFCRRRQGPLTAATLVFLALSLGGAASLWFLSNARQRAREVHVLADVQLLKDLQSQHAVLPALPHDARRSIMLRWEKRAVELLLRRDDHRAALARLRLQANAGEASPDASIGADAARSGWQFADAGLQGQHDVLQKFVADLDALAEPHGLLAQAREWIERTPSSGEILQRWREYEGSPERYVTLPLPLQDRLMPLLRNPGTGLWEFVDLSLGLVPETDADGQLLMTPDAGPIFVLLPGGEYDMGSHVDEVDRIAENEHQHHVHVSPFLISKFEVTQAQWRRATGDNPSKFQTPLRPVENLSWELCQQFCDSWQYALPSEAQWEYACRAGTTSAYAGNGELADLGWFRDNSDMTTHAVGRKAANPFGLYDMHGNVLEWCQDVYEADYFTRPAASRPDPVNLGAPTESQAGPASALPRVLRGGSFEGRRDYCRAANRYREYPGVPYYGFGLRPVIRLQAQPAGQHAAP
jgi:serine/threonine protein kinase/formylglycine-generating enzyme required for sulfatase activity